jgi:molybdopterin synthase catalytic subunit
MRILVRTFAILRELSTDRCEFDLPDRATAEAAWSVFAGSYPGVVPHRPYVRVARNGSYVSWEEPLADGDEVALLPPVSGGSSSLTDGTIDVDGLERTVADLDHGAVVTFVGRARRHADDGREVTELEYEVYPEMAESVLAAIAGEAEARWGARVAVVHRHGVVPLGEAAVVIVVAAPHRAEAYEASRHVIEAIKERLPIWKRERFVDGSEWKRPGA